MKKFFWVLLLSVILSVTGNAAEESVTIVHSQVPLAQYELVTPHGTRIYIDVTNEALLSAQPKNDDILLTTHGHHACNLINTFPGIQLRSLGEIKRPDVYIRSIPSTHLPGDKLSETEGNNYIFVIETAGLRIAHFGGIGQDALTPHQLKELGQVDIAFMLLGGRASIADIVNLKAFNLMDQVKPKMIITTHLDLETSKYGAEIWEAYYLPNTTLTLSSPQLKGSKTKLLFMGSDAKMYGKITKAPIWPGTI